MKHDYAFVEFRDARDADDARHALDGRHFDGGRLIVEFAKGVPRGPGGSREYFGRGPPPGTGRCFNCGIDGHWARDCRAGDWKNKCYRCGGRGHIERSCPNSPKKLRRGRSYSRSVSRSPSPRRGRGRSPRYSRSRSPPVRRDRQSEERRSASREYSRSPRREELPPVNTRSRDASPIYSSPSPPSRVYKQARDETNGSDYSQSPTRIQNSRSLRNRHSSISPPADERKSEVKQNGSDNSQSPVRGGRGSRSPMSHDGRSPYDDLQYQSPMAVSGRSPSPEPATNALCSSPRDDNANRPSPSPEAVSGKSQSPETVNGLSSSPRDENDDMPSPRESVSPRD